MTSMLICLSVAQAAEITSAKVLTPDVVLARADESVEAENALNNGSIAGPKLLFLTTKPPLIACYGRLADETQERNRKVDLVAGLIKDGDATRWSRKETDAARSLMLASPFRDTIRYGAEHSYQMTLQFARTTTVEYVLSGKRNLMILAEEPIGSTIDLTSVPLNLSELPPVNPASRESKSRSQSSVACLVPKWTAARDRIPRMQVGLKALALREEGNTIRLSGTFRSSGTSDLSSRERERALAAFADNFLNAGFKSRAEALSVLRTATLTKRDSLSAKVLSTTPAGEKSSVGWTILGLSNP